MPVRILHRAHQDTIHILAEFRAVPLKSKHVELLGKTPWGRPITADLPVRARRNVIGVAFSISYNSLAFKTHRNGAKAGNGFAHYINRRIG